MKITVERNEKEKIELTIPWDTNLTSWEDTFRIILKWVSFSENQINELFTQEKEEDEG